MKTGRLFLMVLSAVIYGLLLLTVAYAAIAGIPYSGPTNQTWSVKK